MVYLAQGMSGLAYEPVSYLLKDVLHLSAAGAAVFTAGMTLPFLVKPLLGLLSDMLPLFGYRRRGYLLLSSLLTGAAWLLLAFQGSYGYGLTLLLLSTVNIGVAFSDVLCDAVLVGWGQALGKTGSYQAVHIGTLYLCLIVTGWGGGWMAQHLSYRTVFAWAAAFPLLITAATFLVREEPAAPGESARLAWRSLARCARDRSAWAAVAIILLWNFLPYQGTSFFYYQSEVLGFSKAFIGLLNTLAGVFGCLGAGLFGGFCGRALSWRGRKFRCDTLWMVKWSVLAGGPLTLLFLAYRGPVSAVLITAFLGAAGVAMRLSLIDLVTKLCPRFGEAASFALFMAVFDLAALGSNAAGGCLYDLLRGPLTAYGAIGTLVGLGALTTVACWPLIGGLNLGSGPKASLEL